MHSGLEIVSSVSLRNFRCNFSMHGDWSVFNLSIILTTVLSFIINSFISCVLVLLLIKGILLSGYFFFCERREISFRLLFLRLFTLLFTWFLTLLYSFHASGSFVLIAFLKSVLFFFIVIRVLIIVSFW